MKPDRSGAILVWVSLASLFYIAAFVLWSLVR